ncbi:AraC family transcriptional regulator [Jejubacter calystegiae]|uniref:AraC family transcriptional regulator n=1 Tax=Jejubacter calystegiae TaxID=2579935 RepID=A0A4P8YG90_9ENTR|nr:AraC family transcriptional regulator [Jejubacter calystegiae]QCT19601.1 AraC family transcriptional regulator [Jejubacter calystegiae]
MQGVPDEFNDIRDRASFRHLPGLPGVELYRAHIARYAFEPHTHEGFGIGAIEQGAERFRYRGAWHVAGAGSLVTMNPDELHTGQAESQDGWRYQMIYLDPHTLSEISGEPVWWFHDAVRQDPARASATLALIQAIWQHDDPLARQGILLQLVELLRPIASAPPAPREATRRFSRVREYLHDNYMRPVTLDELAAIAALSPWHFQRQFKAHFHVTPHQMLMAIRLWRAKQLLTNGMAPAAVAAATGLSDQAHLTRAFSWRYGITPARYQKQVRG